MWGWEDRRLFSARAESFGFLLLIFRIRIEDGVTDLFPRRPFRRQKLEGGCAVGPQSIGSKALFMPEQVTRALTARMGFAATIVASREQGRWSRRLATARFGGSLTRRC